MAWQSHSQITPLTARASNVPNCREFDKKNILEACSRDDRMCLFAFLVLTVLITPLPLQGTSEVDVG
jgi:hypothetical protein